MPEYKHILFEKQDKLARVKLNRPEYLNAQSQIMLEEMDFAFQDAVNDDDIRVIILSGEGDHFSSGHDLGTKEEMEDRARRGYPEGAAGSFIRMEKIFVEYGLRWRDLPKATIAMIHGYCIYGGWQIASSMDFIVAADDTKLLPNFIEYFSIPWDLGVRKSKELIFQNRFISAQTAKEIGFVNKVVPRERLEAEAIALAETFLETDPFIIRMAKLSINQAQDAQGFRLAIQTALSNFIVMSQAGVIRSPEDEASGKKSLSGVDMAMNNLGKYGLK
jgi:enoyl-CoA hydratase